MHRRALIELLPIAGSAVVAVACAAACLAFVQGCSLKNCESSLVWLGNAPPGNPPDGTKYDLPPPERHVLAGGTTWESMPIDGDYLDFPGERTYIFNPFLDGFTGPYTNIIPYVSSDPQPALNNSNFVIAAGNLAEVHGVNSGGFAIQNDSCAHYYLRVVVTREAPPPDASTPDGSSDGGVDEPSVDAGDASAPEGGLDGASLDAADAGGS
jgi:hypothetical protein